MDDQDLHGIWDALLSRQAARVVAMYNSLSSRDKEGVLAHLIRMSTESGWHLEQRASAIAALVAIQEKTQ
jgi:hypothetical protein